MKKILWTLCLLLTVPTTEGATPAARLKLMSYNIRYIDAPGDEGDFAWEARRESSLRMIRSERPDVIGLQEPKRAQVDYLAGHLPEYGHIEMGRDHGIKPDGGEHLMVMWLRDKYELVDRGWYWLSETPDEVSRGWDAMCRRVTVWVRLRDKYTGHEFYYFNTHLDHKGERARLEGAALNVRMMKRIAGRKLPVFISGDMNAEFGTPTAAYLAPFTRWMKSARDRAPRNDDRATFNGFGKTAPHWLDHIFYRNARPLEYATLDGADYGVRYISDHYPIICIFAFQTHRPNR